MSKPKSPPPKQHVVHQSDSDSDSDKKVAKSKTPVANKKGAPTESDFGGQLQGSVIPSKEKKKSNL